MPDESISAVFQKPFEEALTFFRAKVPLPTNKWNDVAEDYQAIAFTIAGITRLNILKDVQSAIAHQLEKGVSPEQFREEFQDIMTRRGWNPNFSPKRINLILSQNIRNAHQYGRWQQMLEPQMLKRRPYWQWVHGDSPNPRPHHLEQNGKVYPADADIWKAIHPSPFGCRCRAFPLSQRDLHREGLTVSEPPSLSSIAEKGFTKGFSNELEQQREHLVEQALDSLPPNLRRFLEEIEYLEFYDPSQPRDRAGRFAKRGIATFTPTQAKRKFGVDVEDSIVKREDRLRTELIKQLSPKVEAGIKSSVDRVFDDAKKDYLNPDNKDKIDRLESYIDEAKRFASGRLDSEEQKQFLDEYDDLIKDFKAELLSLNQAVGDDGIDELDSVTKFLEGRKRQYERKKRRTIASQLNENENFISTDINRNLDDSYQALKKDPFNEDRQGDFLAEAEFATDLRAFVMGEMSSQGEVDFEKNYQSKLEKYSRQIEFLKNHSTEDDLDGFLGELRDGASSLMAQFDDITTTSEEKEKARKIIREMEQERETKKQKIKNLRDESAALEQKVSRWDAKYKRIAKKADEMSALANSQRGEEANKTYKRVNNIYRALNNKVGSRRDKLREESRAKRNELWEIEKN